MGSESSRFTHVVLKAVLVSAAGRGDNRFGDDIIAERRHREIDDGL